MTLRRLAVLPLAGLILGALALPAAADVEVVAEINGQNVDDANSSDPIELEPDVAIPLRMTLTNEDDEAVQVRFVRLEGVSLGLTFLTYDLGTRLELRAGESAEIEALLDFFDLSSQATGFLGTSLKVYDQDRDVIGQSDSFVVDVKGSATSTLGLFAIALFAIAVMSVTIIVVNAVRRRLPANRFVRGLQFAVAGAAVGVTLALGISILRITFVEVEAWVPLVFIPTVVGFLLGYIAPGPLSTSIEEVKEEEALEEAAEEAVARASGRYTAPGTAAGVAATGQTSGRFSHHSDELTPQSSGEFTPHESGSYTAQDSGKFTPQVSGEFTPPAEDTESE